MRRQITLRNEKAEQFDRIKQKIADRVGYEPTNTEVVTHLLMHYDGPLDTTEPPLFE